MRIAQPVLACLLLILIGIGVGALLGARSAWNEIELHGYLELGFRRTVFGLFEQAIAQHALEGLVVTSTLALAVVALSASPLRVIAHTDRVVALVATRRRLRLVLLGAVAVAAIAVWEGGGRFELVALLGVGVAGAVILAQAGGPGIVAASAARRAKLVALAWVVPLFCLAPFALLRIQRLYPSLVPTLSAGTLAVFLLAAIAFAFTRRMALVQLGALHRAVPRWLLLALASVAFALASAPLFLPLGRRWSTPGVEARQPANVLLIAIDTLRADHTTLAGPAEGRDLTPELRALASRGVLFETAISQASWTLPAMASIVTGQYPLEHGAVSHRSYIRPGVTLLSEVLHEAGYATGTIVSNYYVGSARGFAQGVDEFSEHLMPERAPQPAAAVTSEAIEFIERHADEPFYLLAHYMDPHYEYQDQPELDWSAGYDGWLLDGHLDFDEMVKNRHLMEQAELDHLTALYDEEIARTDREVGRLLAAIARRPDLLANTLIVLVADHGEEFMEHGQLFHTTSLYDELLHVPLVVVPPGGLPAPSKVQQVVETRAIFATVLDVLELDFQAATPSPSLLASPRSDSLAFSLLWQTDGDRDDHQIFNLASVRSDRWKLIWDQTRARHSFYDMLRDPGEMHAIGDPRSDEAETLRAVLDAFLAPKLAAAGASVALEPDAGTRAMLEELGYL